MVVIFKHDNQNYILNSEDIVHISNVLIQNNYVLYFEIKLKTNYIHTFNFNLPLFQTVNIKKVDFLYDQYKGEVMQAIQQYREQDRYSRNYSEREFDFIIKDHHYNIAEYKNKIKEYNLLYTKYTEKNEEIKNKIQSKIDNLIKQLYPTIEVKPFMGEIDLTKN